MLRKANLGIVYYIVSVFCLVFPLFQLIACGFSVALGPANLGIVYYIFSVFCVVFTLFACVFSVAYLNRRLRTCSSTSADSRPLTAPSVLRSGNNGYAILYCKLYCFGIGQNFKDRSSVHQSDQ